MAKSLIYMEKEAFGWLKVQLKNGHIVFRKNKIPDEYLEILKHAGLLTDLNKNYVFAKLKDELADSSFKINFWNIMSGFLDLSFKSAWYITGDLAYQSINNLPQINNKQITISTKTKSNRIITFFNGFQIVASTDNDFQEKPIEIKKYFDTKLYFLKAEYLIIHSTNSQYQNYQEEIVAYLKNPNLDGKYIINYFKTHSSPILLARLIGALEQLSNQVLKLDLEEILKLSGAKVSKENPFQEVEYLKLPANPEYISRLEISIQKAKEELDKLKLPEKENTKTTEKDIDKLTVDDAYNSLTIEGYTVTRELLLHLDELEKNIQSQKSSEDIKNLSAARGFMNVLGFIKKLIKTDFEINEEIAREFWKQLWLPSINAKLVEMKDMYRSHHVYIRGSNYVPPNYERVRELMSSFFNHIKDFNDGFKLAIYLHYFLVTIHPYADGNGRIARFLMNLALVKDKYKWLTIKSDDRKNYFSSLEKSQMNDDIKYFADYIMQAYKCLNRPDL